MDIKNVLDRNRDALLSLDGVVAVGIGYKETDGKKTGTTGIIVSVKKKQSPLVLNAAEVIPSSIDGVVTDVLETGDIKALENVDKLRPAPGGVSIGHKDITAGTFGCVVKRNGRPMILSNNHVLANSNSGQIGDAILQPGSYDGGVANDQIATLEDFVRIEMSGDTPPPEPEPPSECKVAGTIVKTCNAMAKSLGSNTRLAAINISEESHDVKSIQTSGESANLVDAAIAKPLAIEDLDPHILDIGIPTGIIEAQLNMVLQKSGRTTGYTEDSVQQIDVTVDVQYGEGKVARFHDQIMAGPMSKGGDSGSAVLDKDGKLTGLLFAGSDNFTIMNRIQNVFESLDLSL